MDNCYKNKYKQELIGSAIEVIDAKHEGYKNIHGSVVDETKNTIRIKTLGNDLKVVPKIGTTFKLKICDQDEMFKGGMLNHRPEERIKKSG